MNILYVHMVTAAINKTAENMKYRVCSIQMHKYVLTLTSYCQGHIKRKKERRWRMGEKGIQMQTFGVLQFNMARA